jgi:hypothetical protein
MHYHDGEPQAMAGRAIGIHTLAAINAEASL